MSQGILIFAFNNTTFDYVKQALWVADRVNYYLNKPVTIVTNKESFSNRKTIHNVIFAEAESLSKRKFKMADKSKVSAWFNGNRYRAYELSPYDETIVIDSDYIICSDQLNLLFAQPHEFLTHRFVSDLADKKSFDGFTTFGSANLPHYWATVLFFRKTDFAKMIFDLISMIKENYQYYSDLYKFDKRPYRNDHAVSIAQLIAYGHCPTAIPSIPWNLPSLSTDCAITQLSYDKFEIKYEKWNGTNLVPKRTHISGVDIHCLDKFSLEAIIDDSR